MYKKKKKVALADMMVLYGVGLKSIVKYYVSHIPEKGVFKFQVIGERGNTSAFTTKQKEFLEGETLYKHGYRIYTHTKSLEKKYIIYLVRQNLHSKLKKIEQIMARANMLAPDKMLAISLLCVNMIRQASEIDRRIKHNT